jgi:hypothetical protein
MRSYIKSESLPQRDSDEVLTLYTHYFLAAELMFKNYKKLSAKWNQRGRQSQNDGVHNSIYFCTWLGFLAVTAEGFKKLAVRKLLRDARPPGFVELVPRADALGKLLKRNDDALRKFRNNIFHLRESHAEIERFLKELPNRLEWAEELHGAFSEFFSKYRILCQVHYLIENRNEEVFK